MLLVVMLLFVVLLVVGLLVFLPGPAVQSQVATQVTGV